MKLGAKAITKKINPNSSCKKRRAGCFEYFRTLITKAKAAVAKLILQMLRPFKPVQLCTFAANNFNR